MTVYKRADGKESRPVSSEAIGKHNGLGYNPAVEAKGFTKSQVDQVRSKKMRSDWALQDIVSSEPTLCSLAQLATSANLLIRHCRNKRSNRDFESYSKDTNPRSLAHLGQLLCIPATALCYRYEDSR